MTASNERTYVIVSDRPWNSDLAERLQGCCNGYFHLIKNREELTLQHLRALAPRYVFFSHWSYRIPEELYESFECIVFHMTDLPFGRGGSPLQNLIARGFTETVISALQCVEEMDAGPVYRKRPLPLYGTAEEIFLRASRVMETMIQEIISQQPEPVPQEGAPVVFQRRKPEDGDVSNAQDLGEFYDLIRMLDADGYPPAFLEAGPFRLEFSRASRRSDGLMADVKITLRTENHDANE